MMPFRKWSINLFHSIMRLDHLMVSSILDPLYSMRNTRLCLECFVVILAFLQYVRTFDFENYLATHRVIVLMFPSDTAAGQLNIPARLQFTIMSLLHDCIIQWSFFFIGTSGVTNINNIVCNAQNSAAALLQYNIVHDFDLEILRTSTGLFFCKRYEI